MATPLDLLKLIVGQGVLMTLIGLAIGVAGAAAFARSLQRILFGVSPTDAVTFVTLPLLLGAVALAACAIPAWRVTRVHPMTSLRAE